MPMDYRVTYKFRTAALLGLLAVLLSVPAGAAPGPEKGAGKGPWKKVVSALPFRKNKVEEKKDTVKVKSKYEKLLENEESVWEGFITVHRKKGKVYFEVPDSLLGRELALGTTIRSISDNRIGVVGSKDIGGLRFFTWEKADSALLMKELNFDMTAGEAGVLHALTSSRSGAVLRRFPVKATSPGGASVVDVTPFFLSDDKQFSPFQNPIAPQGNRESYKSDLSYIVDAKSFADNLSVTVSRSYVYSNDKARPAVKDKPFTAEMTVSVLLLPREVYRPRIADPRIGFFFTPRTQMGSFNSSSKEVYFANRWRLEPSDTAAFRRGEAVAPVRPVTFYIDNDFPAWWKPYIFDAVLQWNEPFAKIGFKDAVRALPFPEDDPSFDPDNIRYNCIRYAPVGIQNAMGPSWVDPRTGEIINASVYVYHDVIKLLSVWMFVQTAQADEAVRAVDIPQELLGDALMYVIKHEVGHTLGLMHNMSGSSVIPLDSLRSPSFTARYGTTTSIMDYARFNYVAQPGDKERGVKLTPPRFGAYDEWAIRWGYLPVFDAETLEEEAAVTAGWITDSLRAALFYRYGKQQMSPFIFDPRCQTEDLSDDVIGATKLGVANLKYIMPRFMGWISDADDPRGEYRSELYLGLVNQYLRYAGHVLMNIGGLYRNEVVSGDGWPRYENVPRARQLQALECVMEMIRDLDWMEDPSVTGRLPIVGSPVYQVRKSLVSTLFNRPFSSGITEGVQSGELLPAELLDRLYDFAWQPTKAGRKLTAADRQVQQLFVQTLMGMGSFSQPASADAFLQEPAGAAFGVGEEMAGETVMGAIAYDPVSGFEWVPRAMLNGGLLTSGTLYGQLMKAYDLMKQRRASASAEDRAHYGLLMGWIEYGVK